MSNFLSASCINSIRDAPELEAPLYILSKRIALYALAAPIILASMLICSLLSLFGYPDPSKFSLCVSIARQIDREKLVVDIILCPSTGYFLIISNSLSVNFSFFHLCLKV
ncbi:hypothetical protein BDCR2A_00444 [Borrelia duttonii CR2A]|uniref:Uncharacterized protein n=1 Tax=Borrelia duttonii CR2A TaxID=1432657 RepID=W6TZA7_9SPIR|nr:hypothetical protein BDCR2A_00444 [Borrelia duttonii CR2A]